MGIWFADYMQRGLVITNANIQGLMRGIMMPFNAGHGLSADTATLKSSYLNNAINIIIRPPSSVNGSDGLAPMSFVLRDIAFATPPNLPTTWACTNVNMDTPGNDGFGMPNYSVPVHVYMYNYKGVLNDNFEIFWDYNRPSGTTTRSGIDGFIKAF